MARHRQPRELAELKGSTKKNPQRYAKKTEAPKNQSPLGDAPAWMKKKAKDVWNELSRLALPGILTESDRPIFEIAVNLMAEYREDPKEFASAKYTHLIGSLARLGLSPADRQKLQLPANPQEKDDFGDFFPMAAPAKKKRLNA